MLALIWTFAAFGGEMGCRGYLMSRAADAGNRSRLSYVFALLAHGFRDTLAMVVILPGWTT